MRSSELTPPDRLSTTRHRPRARASALPYLLSTTALAVAVFPCAQARAGEEDKAMERGRALYEEAVVLLENRNFAEACPKLEEAVRLVPVAIGARLALAECDEGRGRLATALAGYQKARSLAATASQPDREKVAREQADRLEKLVGRLRVAFPPSTPAKAGLAIELDGAPIDVASPTPIDAGKHTVRATAPGRKPLVLEAVGVDGKEVTVTIAFPEEPAGKSTPLFVVGLGAGALGIAGLAAGAVMGGLAAANNDESYRLGCVKGAGCPTAEGAEKRRAAYDAATASTALFIGGGALAAAGAAVVIAVPSRSPAATAQVTLRVGPSGVTLAGSF